MLLRPVLPEPAEPRDVSDDAGRRWLAERYAPPARYLRLNMITTLTGAAVGADGTSDTLSSRVDRRVLGVIRGAADAVLVGAQTVRAEGYTVPRTADLVVLTATGDLRGHELGADAGRVWLVCPAGRADEVAERAGLPGARVLPVEAAGDRLDAAAVLSALGDAGLHRVVCEGGPRVAGLFADAGLIDEYCVTVAPVLVPSATPFIDITGVAPATEVAGMLVDEAGFSYLRLRTRRDPAGAATP